MEKTDYAAMLPVEPPKGLVDWVLARGALDKELLVYSSEWREGEDGKKRRAVKVCCTSCGGVSWAEKEEWRGCGNASRTAPYGWRNPLTGEEELSGKECVCPVCGQVEKTVHISSVSAWETQDAYVLSVGRVGERLALMGWVVRKSFGRDGSKEVRAWPYEAYVVEKRKLVKLTGYNKNYRRIDLLGEWKQKAKYCDGWEKGELVYPWDRKLLEGSTAENSKLDVYLEKSGGEGYPVTYLRLWLAHPQVENLVTQGGVKLLNQMIQRGMGYYFGTLAVPELAWINWKERSPARMLGMNRELYRRAMEDGWDLERLKFWQEEKKKGRELTTEELELAKSLGFYNCEKVERDMGLDYLKVARYLRRQRARDGRCDMAIMLDYWRMAKGMGEELDTEDTLFPPRLMRAHDRVMEEKRRREEEKEREEMEARAKLFVKRLEELEPMAWEKDDILIRPARSEAELKEEGKALHHCVGGYAGRHASGDTAIFFIRRAAEPDKPWYTLELDEKRLAVRQNRGSRNCDRTEEIKDFELAWLEHIKEAARAKKPGRKKRRKEHAA